MSPVTVHLDAYQGPLDLLLRLIEKNEIDIYDIPISELTEQYIEVIKDFPSDMESISEFLLMAATLLEIKSKMLLPGRETTDDEADPREALAARLAEYKLFKELSEQLNEKSTAARVYYYRQPEAELFDPYTHHPEIGDMLDGVSLEDLFILFEDVMNRRELKTDKIRSGFNSIQKDLYTVEDKSDYIMSILFVKKRMNFSDLFTKCRERNEKVVTFLALLELIKNKKITVRQDNIFDDIFVVMHKE